MMDLHGKTIGKYMLTTRVIGQGAFGEVLLAHNLETGDQMACKVSKKTKREFQPATEVRILRNLHHV